MKLALCWFCILHLVSVSAGLSDRKDPQSLHSSRIQLPQSSGTLNHGRQRQLFARREQFERQRIRKQRPKVVPSPPNDVPPPSKAAPMKPSCSQLTQSCLPQSGCCDTFASCHCRFFNAICFCRRTNSKRNHKKKTKKTPAHLHRGTTIPQ